VAFARIPDGVRRAIVLRWLEVGSAAAVAREFSVSPVTVARFGQDRAVYLQLYRTTPARLGLLAREEIALGLSRGWSIRRIAAGLGRAPSTIAREVNRNGGRERYRGVSAHRATCERGRRPKPTVFQQQPVLAAVVERWLQLEQWSPAQISARLRDEFPDDPTMRVSPETIYQALYVYGRGGLRTELAAHLRSGRTQRRPHTVTARNRRAASPIPDLVSIAERPEDVEGRLVPGHWEGDLLMGRDNKSQVATLVERTTGLVMLGKLANKQAPTVAACLQQLAERIPEFLRGSLTWDRGSEMAAHRDFTVATGIPVYFCDPHAPWQRGSNENTNGLLRQYLPRDQSMARFSQAELDQIAHKLNRRPRARHDFKTPLEVFDKLVLQ
jgi:transposase, IS30 family